MPMTRLMSCSISTTLTPSSRLTVWMSRASHRVSRGSRPAGGTPADGRQAEGVEQRTHPVADLPLLVEGAGETGHLAGDAVGDAGMEPDEQVVEARTALH